MVGTAVGAGGGVPLLSLSDMLSSIVRLAGRIRRFLHSD